MEMDVEKDIVGLNGDGNLRGSVFEDEDAEKVEVTDSRETVTGRGNTSADDSELQDGDSEELSKHHDMILSSIVSGKTISSIHRELNVTRRRLQWFIDHDEILKNALDKARENELEKHYDEILSKIRNGETIRVIHTALGVTRKKLMVFIDNNQELKDAWDDAQEDILDLNEEIVNEIASTDCSMVETESGMFPRLDGRLMASKFNAAKFRLERLGGKRGWNAKIETNEVGNGGRIPVIFCGDVPEESIAEGEALVEAANQDAMKGLEGIPRG